MGKSIWPPRFGYLICGFIKPPLPPQLLASKISRFQNKNSHRSPSFFQLNFSSYRYPKRKNLLSSCSVDDPVSFLLLVLDCDAMAIALDSGMLVAVGRCGIW